MPSLSYTKTSHLVSSLLRPRPGRHLLGRPRLLAAQTESPWLCLGDFSPPSLGGHWSLPSMRDGVPLATQPPCLWGWHEGYTQQSYVKPQTLNKAGIKKKGGWRILSGASRATEQWPPLCSWAGASVQGRCGQRLPGVPGWPSSAVAAVSSPGVLFWKLCSHPWPAPIPGLLPSVPLVCRRHNLSVLIRVCSVF